jgi:hypothetical protein
MIRSDKKINVKELRFSSSEEEKKRVIETIYRMLDEKASEEVINS